MINLTKYKIVLPNMVTSLSIICGMFSIYFTLESILSNNPLLAGTAAWLIIIGAMIDGLDGKVARLTDTASEFGVQYDSMADIITFGVAPSVLSYGHIFYKYKVMNPSLDLVPYIVPILLILCGAIRLARFNVTASTEGKAKFIGLPIPMAASAIALLILFSEWAKANGYFYLFAEEALTDRIFLRVFILYSILLSYLMISNFEFPLFHTFIFKNIRRSPKRIFTFLFIIIMLILGKKEAGFFITSLIYIIPGICKGLYCFASNSSKQPEIEEKLEEKV